MPQIRKPEPDNAQRACDACRARKVRCDKGSPCFNCKSSSSVCRTSAAHNSEPRSRVIISKEYEKKIDRIGDRLLNIEDLLERLTSAGASLQRQVAPEVQSILEASSSTQTPVENHSSQKTPTEFPDPMDYEIRDATTTTHSTVASRMVEQAVGNSSGAYGNSELASALKSLKEMLSKIEDFSSSTRFLSAYSEEREKVDPPNEAEIDKLLQQAEGSITLAFSPGLTVPILKERCNSVFQMGEQPSATRRVYVYGALWHLCTEYSGVSPDSAFAERCNDLSRVFTARIEQAVHDLKLIMPSTNEAAAALTLAAGIAVHLCRPQLAHSLSSKAASIVISLGYHRSSTMESDSEQERQSKILLFWMVYWVDTSFAVRLGHAPVIHHHDITVPKLSLGSMLPSAFVDGFNYSTRISGLHCQVVEQLYSPLALWQSVGERRKRASKLIQELGEAWDERVKAPPCVADDPIQMGLYHIMKESDAVMHYSTTALVQHATVSNANSESPALDSARTALKLNVDAWKTYNHLPDFIWSGHCHWTLMKAPITPFTVTFCHIVAHPSTSNTDLSLLADFVATLKNLCRFSDGMARFYRLCDIFAKVATLYVQAKYNEAGTRADMQCFNHTVNPATDWIGPPVVDEIDEYLTTLGFAPPTSASTRVPDMGGSNAEFDPSYLVDWYQGNTSLMGFLEQDVMFPGDLEYGYMLDPSI